MVKLITVISTLIFIITFPIILLWQPLVVRLIYSFASLPESNAAQASQVISSIYQAGFTPAEISHLEDVSRLIICSRYFFIFSLLVLTAVSLYYKKNLPHFFRYLNNSAFIVLGFILSLFLYLLLNWSSAFSVFHQILFPQGNWAFPADSLLITLFPEIFWQSIFAAYFLLVIILNLGTWLITRFLIPPSRPSSKIHPE